jgi:hypothetical protein
MDWLEFLTRIIIPIDGGILGMILWVRYDMNKRLEDYRKSNEDQRVNDREAVIKEVDRRMAIIEQEIKNHLQTSQQNTSMMLERINASIAASVQNQNNFQLEVIRSYSPKTDVKDMEARLTQMLSGVESRVMQQLNKMEKTAFAIKHKGENNE